MATAWSCGSLWRISPGACRPAINVFAALMARGRVRKMKAAKAMQRLSAAGLLLLPFAAFGQGSASPSITVTSRLVVVPTLVSSPTGSVEHTLTTADFKLLDNGVAQKVSLEDVERQPLAVVVLMQTGATAPRQFENYSNLPSMIRYVMGSSAYKVALVTFDSQPEYEWPFSSSVDNLSDPLMHPEEGDRGAAIFDAVNQGIDMLSHQPPTVRRVLILLSQPLDEKSHNTSEDVIRRLGENNVTLYSVTFSPEKTWLKDQFTKPRHEEKPYQLDPTPGAKPLLHTFDLGTPLGVALRALRTNAADELANLSGGESMPFDGRKDLEQQLSVVANHLPNRYLLTFVPSSQQVGFHTLQVQVQSDPGLEVRARSSYWLSADDAKPSEQR